MEIISSIRALMRNPEGESVSLSIRSASPENPGTPLSAISRWLGAGSQTSSGEEINETISLQITTVLACVRVLSESVASLPCLLMESTPGGNIEATNNPLHYLLSVEPNPEMSAPTFWEAIVGASALTGNGYAEIVRDDQGAVVELYPLHPLMTEPARDAAGSLVFRTRQGMTSGQWREIQAKNCLHFPLFSLDGLKGISPVHQARQALGLARAAEKFGSKWFGNGSRPGGILTGPPALSEQQQAQAKASWEASQGGSNQGRTAVMPGEWTYTKIGLSPEDSQFLATREFQRAEICAMFRVSPHMAGDPTPITNSNYEQLTLSLVQDTLRPIMVRIEAELNRKLMPRVGRKAFNLFARFDLSERLRGDFATQMRGYALGKQWGWYSTNDIRRKLGENPISDPAADVYLYPTNMANAKQLPAQAETETIYEQPTSGEPEKEAETV